MKSNLFSLPDNVDGDERIELLHSMSGARLERIVSHGHRSPPGFWYDQDEDEWVAVLSGRALLELADPTERLELRAGDHLLIPAHRRHRVEWTSEDGPTIWLAVFTRPGHASPA